MANISSELIKTNVGQRWTTQQNWHMYHLDHQPRLLCPLVLNVLWLFELLYHQLPSHFFLFSWRRRKKQYSSAFGEPESLLNLACLSSDIIFHLFQFPGARGTPHQSGSTAPFQAEHSGIDWTDQGGVQLFASPVPQVSPLAECSAEGLGYPHQWRWGTYWANNSLLRGWKKITTLICKPNITSKKPDPLLSKLKVAVVNLW